MIRLDKYLADAGKGTRSQVKLLVRQGRVKVNGEIVRKTELKINPECDIVTLDEAEVKYSEFEYYMLNKPVGVVSATKDDLHGTVVELIKTDKRRDLFPVGRLDIDTEGLLVITNDGKLANNLLAPGKHVTKTYYAKISGKVDEDTISQFSAGIDIGDDKKTESAKLVVEEIEELQNDRSNGYISSVTVEITEGRYHQIKRMFEAVGMKVIYLKRVAMSKLKLDEQLQPGEYRKLTTDEINLLKNP